MKNAIGPNCNSYCPQVPCKYMGLGTFYDFIAFLSLTIVCTTLCLWYVLL